jgi:hypothetical protein
MAYSRKVVGQILKAKNVGETDYIKINEDVSLKKGDFLSLENKASKLASIKKGIESGKLTEELALKLTEQAERQPEFVRFDIVKVTKS